MLKKINHAVSTRTIQLWFHIVLFCLLNNLFLLQKPYCIAKFDFDGETDEDLPFKVGDHIELTGQLGGDWLHGSLDGRQGIFPSAFVEVVQPLPGKGRSL